MKHLTLMIVPYQGAEVKSLKIRHSTLKVLATVAVVLLCALIGAVIYLRPLIEKASEYDRLNAQNQLLTLEKQKIRELNLKIFQLEKLVEKINIAQGIGQTESAGSEGRMAVGDNEPEGQDTYGIPLESNEDTALLPEDKGDTRIPRGSPVSEKSYISRLFNADIYHFGIDIALKQGTPVHSTADGTVSVAERNDDFGYYVMIKHASGYSTLYAHNSKLAVTNGQRVRKGELIAYSGNLGQSSGPHLHYAILDKDGNPIDPLPFLEP